jgi:alkylated DNA repair dioxygenase AlkB
VENKDVIFVKNFIAQQLATKYFNELLTGIQWHNVLRATNGEPVKINRKMAYISDNPVLYKYANLELQGDVWNSILLEIKQTIEATLPFGFNSVLLNLYEDGKDEIRWHSDKEEQLGPRPVIVSINLGAGRTFHMKNKITGETITYFMENGDLLIMLDNCQENWLHAILKEKEVKEPRISLTFRNIIHNE